jgi:hypothetical protein
MRIPEMKGVPPGTPYVSWIVMYGDRDNHDREFACQSAPRTDCHVPRSTPEEQVFSTVYLYYHGAGGETKYDGRVKIGFFQGAAQSAGSRVAVVVDKGESIVNQSVFGIMTSAAGQYDITFALTATVADTKQVQPIQDQIPIVVK